MDSPGKPIKTTSPPPRGNGIAVASTPGEELYTTVKSSGTKRPRDTARPSSPAISVANTGSPATTSLPNGSNGAKRESNSVAINTSSPLALEGGLSKYPASMSSSIRAHVYEGGIRYHAFRDGKYAFPNDDVEQNRDDMKHTMALMLCRGRHFYSPVEEVLEKGGVCLDLGTGTGIWVIEVADAYPATSVTGLDLSPIQPNYVPENVHFFVDDFEEDWVDEAGQFDFIHVRFTLHSVRDRPALLKRIFEHLKPGGYVEFQELHYDPQCDDGSVTPEIPYAFRDFVNFIEEGIRVLGSELNAISVLPDEMKAAGFETVKLITHKCPIGVWPRDKRMRLCGLFMRTVIMDGLRGLSNRPLGVGLSWTPLQIEMFLVDVRKAVMESKFHTYFRLHVVFGRKPLS